MHQGGYAAIQSDMDKLEKRANRNLMQLNKGKCKVQHFGRNIPLAVKHLCKEGPASAGGCQTGHEPAMHVCSKESLQSLGLGNRKATAIRLSGLILNLDKSVSEVMGLALDSPAQVWHGQTEVSSVKGHEDDEGTKASLI